MLRLQALLALFLALPSWASAQDGHAYLGGGIGQGRTSASGLSVTTGAVAVTGQLGTATSTGYKLYGGYQFDPHWGLEAGYNNLGNGYTINASVGGVPGTVGFKVDNWYLAGTGTLPLGDGRFSLLGKLGLVRNASSGGNFCSGGTCATLRPSGRTQGLVSVGAQYALGKKFSLRLEYEDYGTVTENDAWGPGTSGSIKASLWNLSLKYDF